MTLKFKHSFSIVTLTIILFISCKKSTLTINQNKIQEANTTKEVLQQQPENIYNKTFFKVTKTDSIDILYHFCSASINTIRVYKDSVFEDFGQEFYTMRVVKENVNNGEVLFLGDTSQSNPLNRFHFIKKDKNYWNINGNIYIDSLFAHTIPNIIQPCIECWEKEDCDEMEKNKKNR